MSEFRWTDRFGAEHLLDTPAMIDAEVEAIEAEIDAAFGNLRSAPQAEKEGVRDRLRSLLGRLKELREDSERWNANALQQARREAARLAADIKKLVEEALPIMLAAGLHEERLEEFASEAAGSMLLTEPATEVQELAISISRCEPKPDPGLTRGEAREWLQNDPLFARPFDDEGGWFEWLDKHGCMHRLASPLQIELEISDLVNNLLDLMPVLSEPNCLYEVSRAILAANENFDRLSVLQVNLEHFALEMAERKDEEWKKCDDEWQQARSAIK